MNEKWMVRNERSILCAETTVRTHVVCVSGSGALAAVEDEEEAKKLNSLLSPHKICILFPTDLQLAIPIPQTSQLFWCFFSPITA
jgi:hypothetical protein